MNDDAKQSSEPPSAQAALSALCSDLIRRHGRMEIATDDGGVCVLISKLELESLEHALEIYASTDDGQRLHERVAELCESASLIGRSAVAT